MGALVADEDEMTFRPGILDTAPLEVSYVRYDG